MTEPTPEPPSRLFRADEPSDPGLAPDRDDFPDAFQAELAAMGLGPQVTYVEPTPATDPTPARVPLRINRTEGRGGRRARPRAWDRWLPKGHLARSRLDRDRPPVARRRASQLRELVARSVTEPSLAADVRRDRDLAVGLRAYGPGCRRIAVIGSAPGSGQSTVAALIALTLSRVREDRVAAVDLDAVHATLATRLGQPDSPTVAEVAAAARKVQLGASGRWNYPGPVTPGMPLVVRAQSSPAATRVLGESVTELTEAALLALERGVAVTVVDLGPAPPDDVLALALTGATTLVVVGATGGHDAEGRGLRARLAEQGYGAVAHSALAVTCGVDAGASRRRRRTVGSADGVLLLPSDPTLRGAGILDLASARPGTRRAATLLARRAMSGQIAQSV